MDTKIKEKGEQENEYFSISPTEEEYERLVKLFPEFKFCPKEDQRMESLSEKKIITNVL